jgi:peptidoglycan hydrolase-like protein with peptidoglycan-binding domain
LGAAYRNSPPLKHGMRGSGVMLLQAALMDLDIDMPLSVQPNGRPDGSYGNETRGAVKTFQRRYRLTDDGVAGFNTLNALDRAITTVMGKAHLAQVGTPRMVIIHDTRLEGIPPAADLVITVGNTIPLVSAFSRVQRYAAQQAMPIELLIMSHGFESQNDWVGQQSVVRGIGGSGLELGKENLTMLTVPLTSIMNGYVDTITVFVCSAAQTHPGYAGTARDGQRLFSAFSARTSAIVYAADATQWYGRLPMANATSNVIDFGTFEGNLWMFEPDGSRTVVQSNPEGP